MNLKKIKESLKKIIQKESFKLKEKDFEYLSTNKKERKKEKRMISDFNKLPSFLRKQILEEKNLLKKHVK